jgi:hypothetical protein
MVLVNCHNLEPLAYGEARYIEDRNTRDAVVDHRVTNTIDNTAN